MVLCCASRGAQEKTFVKRNRGCYYSTPMHEGGDERCSQFVQYIQQSPVEIDAEINRGIFNGPKNAQHPIIPPLPLYRLISSESPHSASPTPPPHCGGLSWSCTSENLNRLGGPDMDCRGVFCADCRGVLNPDCLGLIEDLRGASPVLLCSTHGADGGGVTGA